MSSYTFHSSLPTAHGPYILGVDEAGRGPVLGALVYGVAYCPVSYKETLDGLGFADSKTLTSESRSDLLATLNSDPANLGWSVRVISPQDISSKMLRHPPTNLNRQSEQATILLIREILARGIDLAEVYVDALGTTTTYQAYLTSLFPTIGNITVTTKADSKFKIVGAASVAAKVTRDRYLEGWVFEELPAQVAPKVSVDSMAVLPWRSDFGSGYPSDPKTQLWLKSSLDPTFGFPSVARFSWTTIKVLLERQGHNVEWKDENHASLIKAFDTSKGRDKERCFAAKDLSLASAVNL